MSACNDVIQGVFKFYNNASENKNGRFLSWEYCYYSFYKARNEKNPDVDYLSLQLAFYLASWGMYRGSSFLLEKDYKVHRTIVEEILKSEYHELFSVNCDSLLNEDVHNKLEKLISFMVQYYAGVRRSVKKEVVKSQVSATLVTKILMGTLGCVPAYDEYFVKGIKKKEVARSTFNLKSISELAEFYKGNYNEFELVRQKLWVKDVKYPQMKLLDMGFWQIGKDAKEEKKMEDKV